MKYTQHTQYASFLSVKESDTALQKLMLCVVMSNILIIDSNYLISHIRWKPQIAKILLKEGYE